MRSDKRFAVFILSHGRADTIKTSTMLSKWYHGDWYVVIDDEDSQEQLYRDKFGDRIIQFCKKDYADKADLCDLDQDRRIGVLARNFIQDEAKRLGYKFHLQLDDDISAIYLRYERNGKLKGVQITDFDELFDIFCEYMENAPLTSLSLGDGAYLIGGLGSPNWQRKMIPKTMTTFFMRADDIQYFMCRMNDDITTSALNGMRGKLYYSIVPVISSKEETQAMKGGMTDIYRENGTYRKSFYSVMAMPSCSKISVMGESQFRIHHDIKWDYCTPRIISERFQKK